MGWWGYYDSEEDGVVDGYLDILDKMNLPINKPVPQDRLEEMYTHLRLEGEFIAGMLLLHIQNQIGDPICSLMQCIATGTTPFANITNSITYIPIDLLTAAANNVRDNLKDDQGGWDDNNARIRALNHELWLFTCGKEGCLPENSR